MTMLASQITSLTVVYSIVYSDVNQRKHQSSAALAFVREIHRGPVNFPHKWPVTRKMFPFDDVIMMTRENSIWILVLHEAIQHFRCVPNPVTTIVKIIRYHDISDGINNKGIYFISWVLGGQTPDWDICNNSVKFCAFGIRVSRNTLSWHWSLRLHHFMLL